MKTVLNKTGRPLKIALSRGRVLRLGPRKEGQIATQDAERDAVQRRVADGDIEIFDDAARAGGASAAAAGGSTRSQGSHARFSVAKRGDR
ncbi:MAG: hypothetical protein OXQ28_06465 [Acidobacteriota bacterium]|nr:hypothetical protein [Acidobacteriota bacterium]